MGKLSPSPNHRQAGAERDGTAALRKGFSVLDLVAAAPAPLKLADVLAATNLPRSTAHRLLSALTEEGLLRADAPPNGGYALGPRLLSLAQGAWDGFDIRTAAAPDLARLRDVSGASVIVAVPGQAGAVYVELLQGASGGRVDGSIGSVVPLHATALGKAMLAGLSPAVLASRVAALPLAASTPCTITDPDRLLAELALARSRFYAIEDEEHQPDVRAIAAPVYDALGRVAGAIGLAGPSFRLPLQRLHELAPDLIEAAKRASRTTSVYPVVADTDDNPFSGRTDARCLLALHAFAAESPVWSARDASLAWVDVVGPALHLLDRQESGHAMLPLPALAGGLVARASGGLVLGLQTGLAHVDPASRHLAPLGVPGLPRPGERIRSLAADAMGRLWITTMDLGARPGAGRLSCLEPGARAAREVLSRLDLPNSPAWSPDQRTLYLADASLQQVLAFDFELGSGRVSNRRDFGPPVPGRARPASLAVDAEGGVWVAHRHGWCVTRYARDGQVERVVALPVPRPSGVAFGGPDMSRLYITSSRIRLSHQRLQEAPLSGSLLAYDTGVRGLPVHAFAG